MRGNAPIGEWTRSYGSLFGGGDPGFCRDSKPPRKTRKREGPGIRRAGEEPPLVQGPKPPLYRPRPIHPVPILCDPLSSLSSLLAPPPSNMPASDSSSSSHRATHPRLRTFIPYTAPSHTHLTGRHPQCPRSPHSIRGRPSQVRILTSNSFLSLPSLAPSQSPAHRPSTTEPHRPRTLIGRSLRLGGSLLQRWPRTMDRRSQMVPISHARTFPLLRFVLHLPSLHGHPAYSSPTHRRESSPIPRRTQRQSSTSRTQVLRRLFPLPFPSSIPHSPSARSPNKSQGPHQADLFRLRHSPRQLRSTQEMAPHRVLLQLRLSRVTRRERGPRPPHHHRPSRRLRDGQRPDAEEQHPRRLIRRDVHSNRLRRSSPTSSLRALGWFAFALVKRLQ